MADQLISALIGSANEAADDLLLQALRVGVDVEQAVALGALMARKTTHGLSGVIEAFPRLPAQLQSHVLKNLRVYYHAMRECGRSQKLEVRFAAMKLIALGRQGKLAYVLTENLHHPDQGVVKAACEALGALARWATTEARRLNRGLIAAAASAGVAAAKASVDSAENASGDSDALADNTPFDPQSVYAELMAQRPEIESAIARALEVHRSETGADLVRGALLLCDSPASKILAILSAPKHIGHSALFRRLQQAPSSELVPAFLVGAAHGPLRSVFSGVFGHIAETPALDALLRKTHWLKDHALATLMHQTTRATWLNDEELTRDVGRRTSAELPLIGEWISASGLADTAKDQRLEQLLRNAASDPAARLRLLRQAARRPRNESVGLIKSMLTDPDEQLARMAAREIIRRRPTDYENMLLQQMTNAAPSVRRVISRAMGQSGFDHYWNRFDKLDRPTRRQAGRAMLKLLPDAVTRLARRLSTGSVEQRVKAMQVAQELELSEQVKEQLFALANHTHPKVRSKAVMLLASLGTVMPDALLEKVLNDTDARVRANAIEVMEAAKRPQFFPLLATRARTGANRERANAIKALHKIKVGTASPALLEMLRDDRSEHKISALWVLRTIGLWKLVAEVGRLARFDPDARVKRYAMGVIKTIAQLVQKVSKSAPGGTIPGETVKKDKAA
jgi:hypothetical protein